MLFRSPIEGVSDSSVSDFVYDKTNMSLPLMSFVSKKNDEGKNFKEIIECLRGMGL